VSNRHSVKIIGLTGGVASGKSTVAQWVRDAGITVIDLDAIGRDITRHRSPLWDALAQLCGADVITPQGLNRKLIQTRIFADPALRSRVEGVLHPAIWAEFTRLQDEAVARGKKLIVCEAALLVETGSAAKMDELVVVTAAHHLRRDRLIQRDQVDHDVADGILGAQSTEDVKKRQAHHIVANETTLDALKVETERLLAIWKKRGWY
jgi:dephospho-CoA kinase